MKKSRRTYNGVHLNKKSNTQDVVEQSLTIFLENSSLQQSTEVQFAQLPGLPQYAVGDILL